MYVTAALAIVPAELRGEHFLWFLKTYLLRFYLILLFLTQANICLLGYAW